MNIKKLQVIVEERTKLFFNPLGQRWFWYSTIAGALVGFMIEISIYKHNNDHLCLAEHRIETKAAEIKFAPFKQNDITDKISLFIWGEKEKR